MRASIVDLRYHMKDVLRALDRNEQVTVSWHGEDKGIIMPLHKKSMNKVEDYEFFGMDAENTESIEKTMQKLRGPRYDSI